jgi:hypothetical protein
MGCPELARYNRAGRTGETELDRRLGQVEQDRQKRTGRTGHTEQDIQKGTGRTGQAE